MSINSIFPFYSTTKKAAVEDQNKKKKYSKLYTVITPFNLGRVAFANTDTMYIVQILTYMHHNLKPILHYALGLRFGKVCEQKLEKNTTGSRFYPTHGVI